MRRIVKLQKRARRATLDFQLVKGEERKKQKRNVSRPNFFRYFDSLIFFAQKNAVFFSPEIAKSSVGYGEPFSSNWDTCRSRSKDLKDQQLSLLIFILFRRVELARKKKNIGIKLTSFFFVSGPSPTLYCSFIRL